ncbi:MAG: trigger factor [Erysipelotrichaceae bacterium]|nr:trigger factor [Erysipelotrichaceae bacterium]
MSSTWTLKEKSQGELVVTVEGEKWQKAQKKAYDKVAKNAKIDGFRQGKVPAALLKKYISEEQVRLEAVDMIANEVLQAGYEEHNIQPITRPELDLPAISAESVTLKFTITVSPEVTLGEYKGLEMAKIDTEVTEEEFNNEMNRILANYAEVVTKEAENEEEPVKVAKGDIAVINFEGFLAETDEAFEGGKGENYPLEIGSGSFIPGFEDQLVGVKLGSRKKVKVTFPEDYGAAELAGKAVYFKCKVNEIKVKKLPELDEELVKELNVPNVTTAEEFTAFIKNRMETTKKKNAYAKAFDEVLEKIVNASSVEIPDVMIEEETDNLMMEFSQRLQNAGYTVEDFATASGKSNEDIRKEMAEDAVGRVKTRLVLEAIAKAEGIKVTPQEIEEEVKSLAKRHNMTEEKVRQLARLDLIAYDVALRKATDFIRESCK